MKNTIFIVTVLLLLMSNELYAVELMRYGFPFGSVEQNGDVRINGNVRGRFEPNGDINGGAAHIELDGSIRQGGRIIGSVDPEGYVRVDGVLKGRVEPNGDIREIGVIGSARGLDKRQAAVIFFFKMF